LLVVAASLLAVGVATFFVVDRTNEPDRSIHRGIHETAAISSTLRLAFNLPCAIYAADADRAYAAMRQRDKKTLMDMVAQRKLRMLRQGTGVIISPLHGLALVNIVGDAQAGRTCYIPSEMISVVQYNGAGL
jgi:hypothetical protein